MKNYIFFLLCSVIFFACDSKIVIEKHPPRRVIRVSFDNLEEQAKQFIDCIEDVSIVPLDLDSVIVPYNPQMRVTDERIYIFSKKQKELHVFKNDGSFLFTISRFGGGPKEYIAPTSFGFFSDGNIFINDATANILLFNKNGNFLHKQKIETVAEDLAYFGDSLYLAYVTHFSFLKENKNVIRFIDNNGKTINSFLKLPEWIAQSNSVLSTGTFFSYFKDSARLIIPHSNDIYAVCMDSAYCEYNVDFGKYAVPESFMIEHINDIKEGNMTGLIVEKGWAQAIDFFQENSGYVFFQHLKGQNVFFTLYNKTTNETCSMECNTDVFPLEWYLVINSFLCSHDQIFYAFALVGEMNAIREASDEALKNDPRMLRLREQYKKYMDSRNVKLEDDDYVLIAYKMKCQSRT
jgi:hypothetical protein